MKTRILLTLFLLAFFINNSFARTNSLNFHLAKTDSVNLLAEFSLFYEYYKNRDFQSAAEHGWKVINANPKNFLQYKPFKKMEDILWFFHDSLAKSDEEKLKIADTTLYLYDKAIFYGEKEPSYFLGRKAYVMEMWKNLPAEDVIAVYENAIATDPKIDNFYKDRLGMLYAKNDNDTNGYKLKALDLYSKLSEDDPTNDVWLQRIDALASNPDELIDVRKKAWELDKENLSKAYSYAETCYKYQNYDKAQVAYEFLVSKAPDVANYWRKLASVYNKLDKTAEGLKAYKKLIEIEPTNRDNYLNIGQIYYKMGQLSTARTQYQKAAQVSPEPWDLPYYYEAQLYEQAARNCGFDFMDKCVYQLAVDTYRKAVNIGGSSAANARERIQALANSVPQKEDYFFRKLRSGSEVKIEGACYNWIGKSIIIP
jgi:tetratricopeptide (TPR) repeat protein